MRNATWCLLLVLAFGSAGYNHIQMVNAIKADGPDPVVKIITKEQARVKLEILKWGHVRRSRVLCHGKTASRSCVSTLRSSQSRGR